MDFNRKQNKGKMQEPTGEAKIICWLFLCLGMESEVWYEAEVLELDSE